jgi:hypothetical protein
MPIGHIRVSVVYVALACVVVHTYHVRPSCHISQGCFAQAHHACWSVCMCTSAMVFSTHVGFRLVGGLDHYILKMHRPAARPTLPTHVSHVCGYCCHHLPPHHHWAGCCHQNQRRHVDPSSSRNENCSCARLAARLLSCWGRRRKPSLVAGCRITLGCCLRRWGQLQC